ncbi:tRNA (adenine(22)-N(1))-methyltransferase [Brevibacillus laterosporus]|uniref:tRNA (adenine(22)-N(1))-methyltransferase n=1 Tax=Brevibacillus laterosporus TaxID=1465 RepID=UPI0018CD9174|nr:tRNA (adenine(22)-N(1))-methyltransferase TrmK [Brevibacillus laterosporus]MBG9790704.1 SAM-dependent methyltransferase [Brevibacillus laterosporus]
MTLTISKRLQTIAAYCPKDALVADIGSDHALLASYLLVNNQARFVIAGELNEGPYQAALRQIATLTAKDRASVRKGDGLAVLAPNEAEVICIAGMGGQLIASILEAGLDKLGKVKRLILQPNVGEDTLRQWLYDHGYQLVAEEIVEEDGIIYEVLVAEPGNPDEPYHSNKWSQAELMEIGPFLLQQQSPILLEKWKSELEKWEKIKERMTASTRVETQEKLSEIEDKIIWIKGVLTCLQTDKPSYN